MWFNVDTSMSLSFKPCPAVTGGYLKRSIKIGRSLNLKATDQSMISFWDSECKFHSFQNLLFHIHDIGEERIKTFCMFCDSVLYSEIHSDPVGKQAKF